MRPPIPFSKLKSTNHAYALMEAIRGRPEMWLRAKPKTAAAVLEIDAIIHGYFAALDAHKIREDNPMTDLSAHFGSGAIGIAADLVETLGDAAYDALWTNFDQLLMYRENKLH